MRQIEHEKKRAMRGWISSFFFSIMYPSWELLGTDIRIQVTDKSSNGDMKQEALHVSTESPRYVLVEFKRIKRRNVEPFRYLPLCSADKFT